MNLYDLLPAYLSENYSGKKIAVDFTDYDGEFYVHVFETDYALAFFALKYHKEIWYGGECKVSAAKSWSEFARDVFAYVNLNSEDKKKLIENVDNLPSDIC